MQELLALQSQSQDGRGHAEQTGAQQSSTRQRSARTKGKKPKKLQKQRHQQGQLSEQRLAASEEDVLPYGLAERPRVLLILDVNGLLVQRQKIGWGDGALGVPPGYTPIGNCWCVRARPGAAEFIAFCMGHFAVGLWSTMTSENLQRVVQALLPLPGLREQLQFVWGAESCTPTGEVTSSGKQLMQKRLEVLWSEAGLHVYAPSATLLVDDDPYKAAANPPHTSVHPPAWSHDDDDDSLLLADGPLRSWLDRLLTSLPPPPPLPSSSPLKDCSVLECHRALVAARAAHHAVDIRPFVAANPWGVPV